MRMPPSEDSDLARQASRSRLSMMVRADGDRPGTMRDFNRKPDSSRSMERPLRIEHAVAITQTRAVHGISGVIPWTAQGGDAGGWLAGLR